MRETDDQEDEDGMCESACETLSGFTGRTASGMLEHFRAPGSFCNFDNPS